MKAARQRNGEKIGDTREVNPGEVWDENEFWLELTWRIDKDGSLGIRSFAESQKNPGTRLGIDEYYEWIFDNSVPGLPERAAAENLEIVGMGADGNDIQRRCTLGRHRASRRLFVIRRGILAHRIGEPITPGPRRPWRRRDSTAFDHEFPQQTWKPAAARSRNRPAALAGLLSFVQ